MKCFLARLQDKMVVEGRDVKVCWVGPKSATFSIKSLYASLEAGRSVSFPTGVVRNMWVPPKVCFLAWEVTWGRASTLD